MKLYTNLIKSVAETLLQVFVKEQIVEQATEKLLKLNPQWGSRDRRWVQDKIYNIVRFARTYAAVLGVEWAAIAHQKESFFSKLVAVAEVVSQQNNEEEIIKCWEDLYPSQIYSTYLAIQNDLTQPALAYSVPDWLHELFVNQLGEARWVENIKALNTQALVTIRINTDLTTLLLTFDKKQIGYEVLSETAILIKGRHQLTLLDIFQKGHFEIQDFNSQQIAQQLDIQPHQTVIDVCAGAGGKTLQIANLLQKSGRIIAMDVEADKLAELQKRAQRAQAKNIQIVPIDQLFNPEKYENAAQKVLIDAPCSGTGVWRRQAGARYKLTAEELQKLTETQAEILQKYSLFCQPKGTLVYATCSILPQENELQIQKFLTTEVGQFFELQRQHTFYPAETQFDGFYYAVLKRLK
jgi:16S rRNA (cytosine967-C5)-methyltransferase